MANVDSRPEGERKRWRGGPSCLLFPPVSIKSVLKTLPENSPSQVLISEPVLPPQPSGKLLAAPRKPRTGQHFWGSCERKTLNGREIESTRPARTGNCARPLLEQALLGDDVMSKRELANHQRVKRRTPSRSFMVMEGRMHRTTFCQVMQGITEGRVFQPSLQLGMKKQSSRT